MWLFIFLHCWCTLISSGTWSVDINISNSTSITNGSSETHQASRPNRSTVKEDLTTIASVEDLTTIAEDLTTHKSSTIAPNSRIDEWESANLPNKECTQHCSGRSPIVPRIPGKVQTLLQDNSPKKMKK